MAQGDPPAQHHTDSKHPMNTPRAQHTVFLPDLLPPGLLLLLFPGMLNTDGITLSGVFVLGPSQAPDRREGEDLTLVHSEIIIASIQTITWRNIIRRGFAETFSPHSGGEPARQTHSGYHYWKKEYKR